MKPNFCDPLYSISQQLEVISSKIANLTNSVNKLNAKVFDKDFTVNNLTVLGSETCAGDLTVDGKTTCAGNLQLEGLVLAADGKSVLIDPANLSCAFKTIQATTRSQEIVDSIVSTNANKSINKTNCSIYVNDVNTSDYLSSIVSGTNFHSTIQIGNSIYNLQPITVGTTTFLGYVLLS